MAGEVGSFVSFRYPAVHLRGTRAHDPNPHVLVLHPNWESHLHGLNLNYLGEAEKKIVFMILNPLYEIDNRYKLKQRDPRAYHEFEDIIGESLENIFVGRPTSRTRGRRKGIRVLC